MNQVFRCADIYFFVPADKLPDGFPQISQPSGTKVVEMGHTALLHCTVAGSPNPQVSWVRDMLPVDTSNGRYTILDFPNPGKFFVYRSPDK